MSHFLCKTCRNIFRCLVETVQELKRMRYSSFLKLYFTHYFRFVISAILKLNFSSYFRFAAVLVYFFKYRFRIRLRKHSLFFNL